MSELRTNPKPWLKDGVLDVAAMRAELKKKENIVDELSQQRYERYVKRYCRLGADSPTPGQQTPQNTSIAAPPPSVNPSFDNSSLVAKQTQSNGSFTTTPVGDISGTPKDGPTLAAMLSLASKNIALAGELSTLEAAKDRAARREYGGKSRQQAVSELFVQSSRYVSSVAGELSSDLEHRRDVVRGVLQREGKTPGWLDDL